MSLVDLLRLQTRRQPVEGLLRHALLEDLVDAKRRHDLFEPRHRHLQFALEHAVSA